MRHISCTEFSQRGFLVLCMNSRFHNNESAVNWELIPLDVAQGVNYLKNVQGVPRVVLFGASGGGVTMSFYQAVAENGPTVCQGPNKLAPMQQRPGRTDPGGRDRSFRRPPRQSHHAAAKLEPVHCG